MRVTFFSLIFSLKLRLVELKVKVSINGFYNCNNAMLA